MSKKERVSGSGYAVPVEGLKFWEGNQCSSSFLYRHSFCFYSHVHISSNEVFSKILKKPSILQK